MADCRSYSSSGCFGSLQTQHLEQRKSLKSVRHCGNFSPRCLVESSEWMEQLQSPVWGVWSCGFLLGPRHWSERLQCPEASGWMSESLEGPEFKAVFSFDCLCLCLALYELFQYDLSACPLASHSGILSPLSKSKNKQWRIETDFYFSKVLSFWQNRDERKKFKYIYNILYIMYHILFCILSMMIYRYINPQPRR